MEKYFYKREILTKKLFSRTQLFNFILFSLFFSLSGSVLAQAREAGSDSSSPTPKKNKSFSLDPDRIIVGGGFGAQFGNITLVELSPTVGYLITENWLAGVGGRYIYYEERFQTFRFKTNIYGASVFSQYFFLENFLAHTELELLNLEDFTSPESRTNIYSFFVGGGYRSMIGGNSFASILLLYNLNDDINSPYTNPVIRVNFGFGL